MTDPIRAALERLIDRMMNERASSATVDAWAAEARAALAALAALPPAPGADTQQLRQIAHAASDYLCGERFPAFAEEHGGLNLLQSQLARLLAHLEHGPEPVPGVDVPGPDGDYGGLQELCEAEGVDVRIGAPLLRRARQVWGMGEPPPPTPALDADTLKEVFAKAIARNWQTGWPALADYVALAVEAQRAPSGNPPATEEYLTEARQEVAGYDNELLQMALRHLSRVQARDGREYSAALCERAAKMIPPASDGEREELASQLDDLADGFDQGTPEERALERAATLLRQPAPAAVPVPVAERPWEREGWCDADGRCWWSHGPTPTARWNLLPMIGMDDAGGWLLPHWAILTPQPPQGEGVQP